MPNLLLSPSLATNKPYTIQPQERNFLLPPKMEVNAETKRSPPAAAGNGEKGEESMFNPRFRSVAEMAGWDEEALLIASLVVEDTPDRQIRHNKRRTNLHFKTPPTNSRRKRRAQRGSPAPVPVAVLNLDNDDESSKQESETGKKESEKNGNIDNKMGDAESEKMESGGLAIPCMDRLREELSCAICLEICFEPSTTPCGHSFCKKCLRSAADKCGKRCPKCRQLISNGRSCTVNTVLWNTIQLLFPQEVEARKASGAVDSRESKSQTLEMRNGARSIHFLNGLEGEVQNLERRRRNHNLGNGSVRPSTGRGGGGDVRSSARRREELPVQDEDAALALRLQREEFMEAFRPSNEQQQQTSASLMLARAHLRAMASRAINNRARGRQN